MIFSFKLSTSLFIILPPSPDPLILFISIPFSKAIFLANGDIKILEFLSPISSIFLEEDTSLIKLSLVTLLTDFFSSSKISFFCSIVPWVLVAEFFCSNALLKSDPFSPIIARIESTFADWPTSIPM